MKVNFVIQEGGQLPKQATPGSSAYDLYAGEDTVIPCEGTARALVPLNFMMAFEPAYEAIISARSGLSAKGMEGIYLTCYDFLPREQHAMFITRFKADVLEGKIDSDYRGIVHVIVENKSDQDFIILKGTRIAQMTFRRIEHPEFGVVESLDDTERSDGGFGHTGTR